MAFSKNICIYLLLELPHCQDLYRFYAFKCCKITEEIFLNKCKGLNASINIVAVRTVELVGASLKSVIMAEITTK